jgi:Domain of unknown function (DUF4124)
MNRYAAFLCLLPLGAPVVCESVVYKCKAGDGHAVYQDAPCVAGQLQVALVASPTGRDQTGGTGAVSEPGSPQGLAAGSELAVGMTDTKVLNTRGWGRPQKVTRTRARDGWREEWTYLSRPEEKRVLQFVNGTLTAAMSEPMLQEANRRTAAEN